MDKYNNGAKQKKILTTDIYLIPKHCHGIPPPIDVYFTCHDWSITNKEAQENHEILFRLLCNVLLMKQLSMLTHHVTSYVSNPDSVREKTQKRRSFQSRIIDDQIVRIFITCMGKATTKISCGPIDLIFSSAKVPSCL
jgi:hypothetical protein